MNKIVCPKCGGQLLFETIGSYGRIHKVMQDGRIGKRARTELYETDGIDSAMVYCLQCGDNKVFQIDADGRITLKEDIEGEPDI